MAEEILKEERAFFETIRAKLLAEHRGKFALIRGSELIGTFDTDENAYQAGVSRFGNVPFLIKRVEEQEPKAQFPALTFGLISGHP